MKIELLMNITEKKIMKKTSWIKNSPLIDGEIIAVIEKYVHISTEIRTDRKLEQSIEAVK